VRITADGDRLAGVDASGGRWLFGGAFVVGGLIALSTPIVAANRDAVP
jgi:hypothetical protein